MIDPAKVTKLISRLRCLVECIEGQHDRLIHQRVDQFYYMQKTEELKLLLELVEEAQRKLELLTCRMDANYSEVFHRWHKDVRWLNRLPDCPPKRPA
jgi:hypothetical protein